MQVIAAKYNKADQVLLLVDQIPALESLRYRKVRVDDILDRGYLYVAEHDGYVHATFQTDLDSPWTGQSNHTPPVSIRLLDGTIETLVSPELPRTDEINRHVPELDVRYHGMTDDRSRFERGSMTHGGYIAGRLYHEVIERLQPTRPLSWLRERYERVEWDLLGTVPPVSRSTPLDGADHRQWLDASGPALAQEALLLEEIALRTAAVRTAAPHRADIVPALAEAFPALRAGTDEVTLPASLIAKVAIYHDSYARPGQTVVDVLRRPVGRRSTRHLELASIANDVAALQAAAVTEEVLDGQWTSMVEVEAPDDEGEYPTYQEYVSVGVFAPYGRRTQSPASSLDDHYIEEFGDDWGNGQPMYDIGPSGTDEEHYEELAQYRLWLIARGLRALEAAGRKAIPHGSYEVDVDRLLTAEFGPSLLDRDDPAIRAAAALMDTELAVNLFNTPNTQWVLAIGDDELRQLGLDTRLAIEKVSARMSQPVEPWVPDDLGSLLGAAPAHERLAQLHGLARSQLTELARSASTRTLLGWVEQARLPQPIRPVGLLHAELDDAQLVADAFRSSRDEERRALDGLRGELEQVGTPWWPGNRRRRTALEARIAERTEVVARLDADVAQADDALAALTRQDQAAQEVWTASHAVVLDRGAVAVLELERREDHLLARYLEDPPQHLLDSIGAPPPDWAGQQAWRDQAWHLQRARTTDVTLDQAVRGPGERQPADGPPEPKDLARRPRDELGHNDLATDRASDDWEIGLEP